MKDLGYSYLVKSHLCPGLNSAMKFTIFRFSSKVYDFSLCHDFTFQSSEINTFYVFCDFSLQRSNIYNYPSLRFFASGKQELLILRLATFHWRVRFTNLTLLAIFRLRRVKFANLFNAFSDFLLNTRA